MVAARPLPRAEMQHSSHEKLTSFTNRQSTLESELVVRSATLPLHLLLGVIIGGVAVLLIISASIVYGLKWKRRRDAINHQDIIENDKEKGLIIRGNYPTRGCHPLRKSYNPFLPQNVINTSHEYDPATIPEPPVTRPHLKRFSPQKTLFRISGMRESWPLVSAMQMPTIPFLLSQERIAQINTVDRPRHDFLSNPQWPKTIYSGASATNSLDSDEVLPSIENLGQSEPKPPNKRRSTSENQLSTTLRTRSQRLNATHKRSMTRTWSNLSCFPGVPPTARLPSPPQSRATESREVLLDATENQSNDSSINDTSRTQTPSPNKKVARSAGQVYRKRGRSPTPTGSDDDSLCGVDTPDLVIPAQLTSPSKLGRSEQRHRISISSVRTDLTALVEPEASRVSVLTLRSRGSVTDNSKLAIPHRISLASDPFYSSVKSSRVSSSTKIQGPRPLYIRKATFGQEATSERPPSGGSVLQDISGNQMSPVNTPRSSIPAAEDPNPFQWSPQETMQISTPQASPKRSNSRRKGHKRSNIIRLSGLSRPSSVCIVPEEAGIESSPSKFQTSHLTLRMVEPSPSLASISSRNSFVMRPLTIIRPPSAANFNPSLTVPEITSRSGASSPTLGLIDYSPTLSVCNYYSIENTSEDEFFKHARSSTTLKSRRHCRSLSDERSFGPDSLVSFPALSTISMPPVGSPPMPLSQISVSGRSLVSSIPSLPAPPLLTFHVPSNLIGPRTQPRKDPPSILASRNSLQTSIGQLRRMNSEVSSYSTVSTPDEDDSPSLPERSPDRPAVRGSKAYLSLGKKDSSLSTKRRSEKVEERKRRRRAHSSVQEEDDDSQLTTVCEVSSPTALRSNGLNIQNLRFPTISSIGTPGKTPPKEIVTPVKGDIWADTMAKPALSGTRRESRMEHPSPQTPPKWAWKKGSLMGDKENAEKDERPESLGLYDQDGFLKSSPLRERGVVEDKILGEEDRLVFHAVM